MAISCPHCPLQCPEALAWLIDLIIEHDPDYFVLEGDLFEADAASKFMSEYPFTLTQEFNSAHDYLFAIREAHERKRKKDPRFRRLIPGNHCNNLLEWNRISAKLRNTCDWRAKVYRQNEYKHVPELKNWTITGDYCYDQSGVFRIGQVSFAHGYKAGIGGDEQQALELNANHPNSLLVLGHTHRPVPVTQARKGQLLLPYHYCNVGTMGPLKPYYMKRKSTANWGAAVAFGDALETKSPRMTKCWDAEVKVFRWARDLKGGVTKWPDFKDEAA
jgi:predicted MPP superfamily phosphohydrolase